MKFLTPIFLCLVLVFSSCMKGEQADMIIHNAQIHTIDDQMHVYEAMAIKDGKILELGPERQILNKYRADEVIDANKGAIYPGLVDGHGHILGLADMNLSVNLFFSPSMDDLVKRIQKYQDEYNRDFVIGRGWDQSLWGTNELPTNDTLNALYPDIPVVLSRVDGHALLVNQAAIDRAGITKETKVEGGSILQKDGKLTGVLVDNAMLLIDSIAPRYAEEEMLAQFNAVQEQLLGYGIIEVHEAGIGNEYLPLFEKWSASGQMKINVYGMLSPDSANLKLIKEQGHFNYGETFAARSIKMYVDGALGSRGALLKEEYSDDHGNVGLLLTPMEDMKNIAQFCLEHDFQLNSHAIGDSANKLLLNLYKVAHAENPDHRWRIEHAQIVDPADIPLFSQHGILPSVQPTHATTDRRWVHERLGEHRMEGAYAYQSLLNETGMLILGTDFPVERTNPFLTIQAAVARQDDNNEPDEGFLNNEAISLNDCLRGMTIWPAIGRFNEKNAGSLEVGKEATFVWLQRPIAIEKEYQDNFSMMTVIRGEVVYRQE